MTFACSLWESASSMAEDICIIRQAANLAALGCQQKPRETEREGERSPAKTSHLSVQAHSYPVSLAFPSSLACLVYWSSAGLCVKTAQQKNPRVATVEAGSLQSSPDERLQLTVAQWDTAGAAGTVGQIDKVTSEISG